MLIPKEEDLKSSNQQVDEIIIEIDDIFEEKDIYFTLRDTYDLKNPKLKDKYIKFVERNLVRKSYEYNKFIGYLRNNLNITKCTFLPQVDTSKLKKTKLEFHHYPIGLYDIVSAVTDTLLEKSEDKSFVDPYKVAELVMLEHYKFNVGLVPLSKTVHELYHSGKKFINLKYVYGNYNNLLTGEYMNALYDLNVPDQIDSLKILSEKDDRGELKEDILNDVKTRIIIDGVDNSVKIKNSDIQIS